MRLTDLNPEGGIGANSLFVEIGPFRLLIDAGMNPKLLGHDACPDFRPIGAERLDLVVLTHCHLDHLGCLPVILRQQPQAQVLMSQPTANIAPRMLVNSCNVMKRQREEEGIKEYPLYTMGEIKRIEEQFLALPFHQTRIYERDGEELAVTLYPAGHIPGAAGVLFEYKHRRHFFTGDVLFRPMRILKGANFPDGELDVLVTETTRGDTRRPTDFTIDEEIERLLTFIINTMNNGGSVLIPVFALGRMQEVLFLIHEAMNQGRLAEYPVFCSGLGLAIIDHFDTIAKKTGLVNFRKKILHDLKAKPLARDLNPGENLKQGIYVLSSGMMVEHTPSYMAAASLLDHSQNAICFVGYCDPDTPGGELLASSHGEKFFFEVLDYEARIRAQIERFDLSGHADREELLDYAINRNPRAIVLTHGDQEARDWFVDELYANPITMGSKIIDPEPLVTMDV